jgi:hypothetical protein
MEYKKRAMEGYESVVTKYLEYKLVFVKVWHPVLIKCDAKPLNI